MPNQSKTTKKSVSALPRSRDGAAQSKPVVSNQGNSLLWLARHKDKAGTALIGQAAYAAGERLRSDIDLARMVPSVTMSWSQTQHVDTSRGTGALNPSEATMAARQRMNLAMKFVGPEFSGILIDLCGFDKGLEAIESERHWPARSGKLVLRLALECLARHYGYADSTKGPIARNTKTWRDGPKGTILLQD
jgi:Domain of unknown function (DUF6456)